MEGSQPEKVDPVGPCAMPGVVDYHCPDCGRFLFRGKLAPGTFLECVCRSGACKKSRLKKFASL